MSRSSPGADLSQALLEALRPSRLKGALTALVPAAESVAQLYDACQAAVQRGSFQQLAPDFAQLYGIVCNVAAVVKEADGEELECFDERHILGLLLLVLCAREAPAVTRLQAARAFRWCSLPGSPLGDKIGEVALGFGWLLMEKGVGWDEKLELLQLVTDLIDDEQMLQEEVLLRQEFGESWGEDEECGEAYAITARGLSELCGVQYGLLAAVIWSLDTGKDPAPAYLYEVMLCLRDYLIYMGAGEDLVAFAHIREYSSDEEGELSQSPYLEPAVLACLQSGPDETACGFLKLLMRAVDEQWEAPQQLAPTVDEEEEEEPEALVEAIICILREMVCIGPDVGMAMLQAGMGPKVTAWQRSPVGRLNSSVARELKLLSLFFKELGYKETAAPASSRGRESAGARKGSRRSRVKGSKIQQGAEQGAPAHVGSRQQPAQPQRQQQAQQQQQRPQQRHEQKEQEIEAVSQPVQGQQQPRNAPRGKGRGKGPAPGSNAGMPESAVGGQGSGEAPQQQAPKMVRPKVGPKSSGSKYMPAHPTVVAPDGQSSGASPQQAPKVVQAGKGRRGSKSRSSENEPPQPNTAAPAAAQGQGSCSSAAAPAAAPGREAEVRATQPPVMACCAKCGIVGGEALKPCKGCGAVAFCSRKCQRAYFNRHIAECKRLQHQQKQQQQASQTVGK